MAGEESGRWTNSSNNTPHGKRYLIHDHDPLFTAEFRNLLADGGVESVKIPPRSPNLNAHAERFVRSIKESCLERMIWFGEDALRQGVHEFTAHYHHERNHQGLDNRLIQPEAKEFPRSGKVERTAILPVRSTTTRTWR